MLEKADVPLSHYAFALPAGVQTLTLKYHGTIQQAIRQTGKAYGCGFSQTLGTITQSGMFLAGSSFWYSWFGEQLITFSLDVHLPPSWQAISQGRRTRNVSQDTQANVR